MLFSKKQIKGKKCTRDNELVPHPPTVIYNISPPASMLLNKGRISVEAAHLEFITRLIYNLDCNEVSTKSTFIMLLVNKYILVNTLFLEDQSFTIRVEGYVLTLGIEKR